MASLACASLIISCRPAGEGAAEENVAANAAEPGPIALPVAEPLDREALLLAVMQAASAAALGHRDDDAQRKLDGDPFEFRLRFGCAGATAETTDDRRGWNFDEERRVLRVHVDPDLSSSQLPPGIKDEAGFEAIEGFWLRRPWLLAAGCPVAKPPTQPSAEGEDQQVALAAEPAAPIAQPRIGVAQFFTKGEARTQRREERAYEATATLGENEAPSPEGYDLILSGRLKRLPNGRVIACAVSDMDSPPACVISVQFDRVWIERPDTREMLAEWGSG